MPRFAANLTFLFTELPFLDRFSAARTAGFKGVEVLFPYDNPAPDLLDRLVLNDLALVLINGPPPNYTEGPRGFAAVPGGQARFQHDFKRAARYAKALGAQHLHLMAGVAEGAVARATYVENLRWAAAQAPGQSLTIEPINQADMPGYFLSDYDVAMQILAEVAAPNVRLQFDAYHAHRITGDAMGCWAKVAPHVAHVQVAGYPGRHEPADGEIDYTEFFRRLDADRYAGWVSGEYHPVGSTADGLGWME